MIKIKLSYSKEGVCRGNWLILSNWAMNFHTVVVFWMENNNCIIICSLNNNILCMLAHLKKSSILLYLTIELRTEC